MIEPKLIEKSTALMLEGLGCNLEDANFKDTPKRVAKALIEILDGQDKLEEKIQKIFSKSFPTSYKGMVTQKNIKAIGMCPHHMQPIQYMIDIGYIPNGEALGLSKLVRLAELLAARMVLQETLTQDIVEVMMKNLNARGAIAVVRGSHGCMVNRGVKQEVITTTSSISGTFEGDFAARQEFFMLNNHNK